MLLTTTCLADQTVAEKMRRIAATRTAQHELIELAADEAVWTYQKTGDSVAAVEAGLDAIANAIAMAERELAKARPVELAGLSLLENGWVITGLLLATVGLLVARANGWLL